MGAECLSDLDALRGQPQLFGPVASRPSAQRGFEALGRPSCAVRRLRPTPRPERPDARQRDPDGETATIDLDATIVRTRADKEDAAPTHDRPAPRGVAGGPPARRRPRPHHKVPGRAHRLGHRTSSPRNARPGTSASRSAPGSTAGSATPCCSSRKRTGNPPANPAGASATARRSSRSTTWSTWRGWPDRTRLIVGRKRPHPGAQLSLFGTIEALRHTAFITDTDVSTLRGETHCDTCYAMRLMYHAAHD